MLETTAANFHSTTMNGHHYGGAYDLETLANRYQPRTAQAYSLMSRSGANETTGAPTPAPCSEEYDPAMMTGAYGAPTAAQVAMAQAQQQQQHQRHAYAHHAHPHHQFGHLAHHHLTHRTLLPSAAAAAGSGGENGSVGGGSSVATMAAGGATAAEMEQLSMSSKVAAVARRLGQSPVPTSNMSSNTNSPVGASMSARLEYGRANLQNELMHAGAGGVNAFPEIFQSISAVQYQQQTQLLRQQQHQQQLQQYQQQHLQQSLHSAPPTAAASPKRATASKKKEPPREEWLDEVKIDVPGLSLEPLSGAEVLKRLKEKTKDVIARYLPCVDFLVSCQQELRKGLAAATQKTLVHHMFRDSMTPQQFYQTYIAPLPDRFQRKNRNIMPLDALEKSVKELHKLCADARGVEIQGCEAIKNTFLGGMKDGESWGLRKWLSKNGAALHICNDCECILGAARKLDRSLDSTKKLSARMRPMAEQSLNRLKADVPSSYQEVSTAHPYLPFFHRLESALRAMSSFDPEDDDVICIDSDDDDDVVEVKPAPKPPKPKSKQKKRKAQTTLMDHFASSGKKSFKSAPQSAVAAAAHIPVANAHDDSSSSGSEDGDVIEILEVKAGAAKRAESPSADSYLKALSFYTSLDEELAGTTDAAFDPPENAFRSAPVAAAAAAEQTFYAAGGAGARVESSPSSSDALRELEEIISATDRDEVGNMRPQDVDLSQFWNEPQHFMTVLQIFAEVLRHPDSCHYVDPFDDEALTADGYDLPYATLIKNPLCFSDIMRSMKEARGRLEQGGLRNWNLWRGLDLLQAIDLVFVNDLAYGRAAGEGRSHNRSRTNKLRKILWNGIKTTLDTYVGTNDADRRRKLTPTRRGESSGFVIHKR